MLADASPSMDPWRPLLATVAESLRFGRLASAELRCFSNLPRRQLFADAEHCSPQPLDAALLAAGPDRVMLPLDATHLLRAVDILRGNK